ncbi:hypothetical protein KY316_03180, partial [Candidatus Woesearchaeota archaeon]|nr:hypothetical protein [Candidatus Woesearchaeota archaeon]
MAIFLNNETNQVISMEEVNEKVLEDLGLSKNEAKVYLSLIHLGSSTAGAISKNNKVPRPNVYDALERLKEKGLAAETTKDNKKYFSACDAKNLMNILKEKEMKLNSILPSLMLNQQLAKDSEARIFKGAKAVRN